MGWSEADIPDLSHRVAVVTGANSGIGFETARALAAKGARVILACRSRTKGPQAVARIREVVPGADVLFDSLDLASLESVALFAPVTTATRWERSGMSSSLQLIESSRRGPRRVPRTARDIRNSARRSLRP